MAEVIRMVAGDTDPARRIPVTRAGEVVNLTGYTIALEIKLNGTVTNTGHQACTIVSDAGGTCQYEFQTGDVPSAGTYLCDFKLTKNGKLETFFDKVIINARAA